MNIDYPIFFKKIVSDDVCQMFSNEVKIVSNASRLMNPHSGYEDGFAESFNMYCPPCAEALSLLIKPKLEEYLGIELLPSYSYVRLYKKGSQLNPHFDRRSSEFTLTLCLSKDSVMWPICVDTPAGAKCFNLDIGDAIMYQGRVYKHWREGAYAGDDQVQAFIQYVDKNGDSADLEFDGKPALGLPWEAVPEWVLTEVDDQLFSGS